jgi:hypothetical protein
MAGRTRLVLTTLALAASAVALPAAAGIATAAPSGQSHVFEFRGKVEVAPGPNATQLVVNVTGGNRPALKAALGAPQPLTFATGGHTKWTLYDAGKPVLGASKDVAAGDPVTVRVRAPKTASLADILAREAAFVGDFANNVRPEGRQYLFGGRASAVDTTAKTITLTVNWGNWRALHAMLGSPVSQTFHYSDQTIFVTWKGGMPHLLTPDQITAGDPLRIRVFGPKGSSLADLTATAAYKVHDREPAALSNRDAASGAE